MRTERRPAPSSPSRTTGTSAPTDRTTVTAVTPRFIPRRAPSPTRRRTACRVHLRCARPSRNGLSAKQLELGAAPGRRSRLRGPPSRSRRPTTIVTTRRPHDRPKARTLRGRGPNQPPNGRDRRQPAARSATTSPAPLPPRRNPPRDWAAPPPWATGPGMSSGAGAAGAAAGAAGAGAGAAGAGAGARRSRDATTASSLPNPRHAGSPAARPIAWPVANRSSTRRASRRTRRRGGERRAAG